MKSVSYFLLLDPEKGTEVDQPSITDSFYSLMILKGNEIKESKDLDSVHFCWLHKAFHTAHQLVGLLVIVPFSL